MNPTHLVILLCLAVPSCSWIVPQPTKNVWKRLAQALGKDHICLSTSSAANPFLSCLVGIPYKLDEFPFTFPKPTTSPVRRARSFTVRQLDAWRNWVKLFPPMDKEPQELDLLGSSPASTCVHFAVTPDPQAQPNIEIKQYIPEYTTKEWCWQVIQIPMFSTPDNKPHSLPKGTFLICGTWAWAGISPPHLIGGPCTFGQLCLFTLYQTQISHSKKLNETYQLAMFKRDTELTNLDKNCNSEIIHWSKPKGVATITFLSWVAIAHAFRELADLECWVAKQANVTSTVLAGLLSDEEVTRQATLQNRAAIVFLLLLHDHSCEEFEGLCCMNLTSKAGDVHKAIDSMRSMIKDIKKKPGDWLSDLFGNWGVSGWATSIIRSGLLILFVLILSLIIFGILR
nr:uncharacterized protein LOC115495368 [Taeniopygia guttata]